MHTIIPGGTFPEALQGISDGTVAGTHFTSTTTGKAVVPAGVTVQQEGLSVVRIRFARHYGLPSIVMGPDNTVAVHNPAKGQG
jgi:hypothetical protein